MTVTPPLQLLVMIANPSDVAFLDVEAEWGKIAAALAPLVARGLVELTRLENATLAALQRQLRQRRYHIFHFIGHGGQNALSGERVLYLEEENGRARAVSGDHLGTLLSDHRSLRLVLLNACEGARAGANDPFAGVAQHLVLQGTPAIIAMQFEITDAAALILAQEFYAAVADGYPVEAALAEARKAIFVAGNDVEWGTPVLYSRANDGLLFKVGATLPGRGADQSRKADDAPSGKAEPPPNLDQPPADEQPVAVEGGASRDEAEVTTTLPGRGDDQSRKADDPPTPSGKAELPPNLDQPPADEQPVTVTLVAEATATLPGRGDNQSRKAEDPPAPSGKAEPPPNLDQPPADEQPVTVTLVAEQVPLGREATATLPGRGDNQSRKADDPPTPSGKAEPPPNLDQPPTDLDDLVLIRAKELLGYDFRIGKYPVTNLQFRRFFEANGYSDNRWWPDQEGRKYHYEKKWEAPPYWDDKKFNQPAHPIVGVSWYEATVYCAWLTAQWQAAGTIAQGEQVRLPTRDEWMAAARGGQPAPVNAAEDYPWRGPFDAARANTKESGIGQTTPVHQYPNGRTVDGVWDLSGNVWEWTNDRAYLKGGSWYNDASRATAAAALDRYRRFRSYDYGIRVVAVLISR